uniref:Uncharacterized protein n=1 Tax=Anguilla anguilla TaxID=7936 RepID=A0A0E9S214_ANGAN
MSVNGKYKIYSNLCPKPKLAPFTTL